MKVDVGAALREGLRLATRRNGLAFVGIFAAFNLTVSVAADWLAGRVLLWELNNPVAFGEEIRVGYPDVTIAVIVALSVAAFVLRLPVKVGAVRAFANEETDRLPADLFTRRLGRVVVRLVAGTVLYLAAVVVGLFLLVFPGLYLAVALFFFNFEIVVADKGVLEAFRGSWELTEGNRVWLFVLAAVVAVSTTVASDVVRAATPADATLDLLLGAVVDAGIVVFGIAVAAQAYNQLRGESLFVEADEVGAVTAEDLA